MFLHISSYYARQGHATRCWPVAPWKLKSLRYSLPRFAELRFEAEGEALYLASMDYDQASSGEVPLETFTVQLRVRN